MHLGLVTACRSRGAPASGLGPALRYRIGLLAHELHLYPELSARHRMYAGYQDKTDREIPLVWLEPA